MNEYDVKRLALVLAIQAEIEGMKIRNKICGQTNSVIYSQADFDEKAERLRDLAYAYNEQL